MKKILLFLVAARIDRDAGSLGPLWRWPGVPGLVDHAGPQLVLAGGSRRLMPSRSVMSRSIATAEFSSRSIQSRDRQATSYSSMCAAQRSPTRQARHRPSCLTRFWGSCIDRFNRLWTIDHGNHGLRPARIVAIDLDTNEVIREQSRVPPISHRPDHSLQDLQVSADGNTIVIADASFWRKSPAIIVYDVETGEARRVLESHESVSAENYVIRSRDREMKFLGGIAALRGGIDGIALGQNGFTSARSAVPGFIVCCLGSAGSERCRPTNWLTGSSATAISRSAMALASTLMVMSISRISNTARFSWFPQRELKTLIQSATCAGRMHYHLDPRADLYIADSALLGTYSAIT